MKAVVVVLVLVSASWLAISRSACESSSARAQRAETQRIAELQRQLGSMRAELEQVRRQTAALGRAQRAAAARDASEAPAGEAPATGEQQHPIGASDSQLQDDPGSSIETYADFVSSRFEAEARDPDWDPTPELDGKLRDVLGPGSTLHSLECRSSICKLQTAHPDQTSYEGFTRHFTFLAGDEQVWSGASFFQVTHPPERDGDELLAVTYLGRNSLPVVYER